MVWGTEMLVQNCLSVHTCTVLPSCCCCCFPSSSWFSLESRVSVLLLKLRFWGLFFVWGGFLKLGTALNKLWTSIFWSALCDKNVKNWIKPPNTIIQMNQQVYIIWVILKKIRHLKFTEIESRMVVTRCYGKEMKSFSYARWKSSGDKLNNIVNICKIIELYA